MGHDLQEKSFMYLFRGAPINCSLLHVCKEVYYIVSDIIPTSLTLRIVLCVCVCLCVCVYIYIYKTNKSEKRK